MTDTPSTLDNLLADCDALGIHLAPSDAGELDIDAPQGALTPDLLDRLKSHKVELLAMLQSVAELGTCEDCGQTLIEKPTFDGFLNLECPGCDRCFGCRPSTDEVASRFAGASEKAIPFFDEDADVFGEVDPCPECGSVELWQSLAGDLYGLSPSRWCCMKCDPPTVARQLADAAERIRRRENERANNTIPNG